MDKRQSTISDKTIQQKSEVWHGVAAEQNLTLKSEWCPNTSSEHQVQVGSDPLAHLASQK